MPLHFEDWGLIDYGEALHRQEALVEKVYQKTQPASIIFCTHPPIVTKGRSTLSGDITEWKGPIFEINRGGRATYHGPSQILIYPIIPLAEVLIPQNSLPENSVNNSNYQSQNKISQTETRRKPSDVGSFLRHFELAIVDTLKELGISAVGKSYQPNHQTTEATKEETGVWVENKKIASLGLSFRHWISFHGAALNVEHDPKAFQGLLPCGFSPSVMTSIEEILGEKVQREYLYTLLKKYLNQRL